MIPRICMLIERYEPFIGGSEVQCRLLTNFLRQQGTAVFVLTRKLSPELPAHEVIDHVDVYRVPPSGYGRIWYEFIFAFSASWELVALRHRFDVVHLHSGTSIAGAVAILVVRLLRKKSVVKIATAGDIHKELVETSANVNAHPSFIHRIVNRVINSILKMADRIIGISREISVELQNHGFLQDKLVVIPNAIDAEVFSPADRWTRNSLRAIFKIPNDKIAITFSGRLIHRKGIDLLVRAWATAPDLHSRAMVLIVGSGRGSLDSVEDQLQNEVRQRALTSSILFLGERKDVFNALQASDIFIFPSRREGLPNALLEAMSVGLPVVASAIGGNVDVVTDGENGLLFSPGSVEELTKDLRRLINDNSLRERLGHRARETVLTRFDTTKVFPKLIELYRQLYA